MQNKREEKENGERILLYVLMLIVAYLIFIYKPEIVEDYNATIQASKECGQHEFPFTLHQSCMEDVKGMIKADNHEDTIGDLIDEINR